MVKGPSLVIWWSQFKPSTLPLSGFVTVLLSWTPWLHFVYSQLVYLLPFGAFQHSIYSQFSICLYLPWKPPKGSGQLIIHTPPQITTLQLPLPVTKAELLTWPHNPLTPMSDWHLISPHSITLESNVKVMRIQEMITNLKSSRMLNIFSLSAPQEMYRKQYGEYPYWC